MPPPRPASSPATASASAATPTPTRGQVRWRRRVCSRLCFFCSLITHVSIIKKLTPNNSLAAQFAKAGLDASRNRWWDVYDFTPEEHPDQKPHFTLLIAGDKGESTHAARIKVHTIRHGRMALLTGMVVDDHRAFHTPPSHKPHHSPCRRRRPPRSAAPPRTPLCAWCRSPGRPRPSRRYREEEKQKKKQKPLAWSKSKSCVICCFFLLSFPPLPCSFILLHIYTSQHSRRQSLVLVSLLLLSRPFLFEAAFLFRFSLNPPPTPKNRDQLLMQMKKYTVLFGGTRGWGIVRVCF